MKPKELEQAVEQAAPGRTTTAKFMGWRPDIPDPRDYSFVRMRLGGKAASAGDFPVRSQDARIHKHPVFDQGPRGSCVGQSVAVLHAIERRVTPRSALFGYWHARRLIGETHIDAGAYIRDGIKVTNIEGLPRDDLWPDEEDYLFRAPTDKPEEDAEKRRVFNYFRLDADPGVNVNRGQAYRACLSGRYPHCFVIGFGVFHNFWETGYNGGLAPMPAGSMDGGHAVIVYGYDDDFPNSDKGKEFAKRGLAVPQSVYLVRNSWGSDWGDGGDFYVPTSFFENPYLADDAWTVRKK